MIVSVITPSRLAVNPASPSEKLFIDRSLMSARRQVASVDIEVVVGVDRSAKPGLIRRLLARIRGVGVPLPRRFSDVLVAYGEASQASAVNAAVRMSNGDVIAILEDDDVWDPCKLELQLPLLNTHGLVTCNQREVDADGNFLRYNDFATPSGWVMRRETWDRIGGFGATYRYHLDNDFLGRANRLGIKRVHLIHDGHVGADWLAAVAKVSAIAKTDTITEPLVSRFVHGGSGMHAIRTDAEAKRRSDQELETLREVFGELPW